MKKTMKTTKEHVNATALRQQAVIDYISDGYEIDTSRPDIKEHTEARVSVQHNKYALLMGRRMCDAPNEQIPSAKEAKELGLDCGYCVKVTNLVLSKQGHRQVFVITCPTHQTTLMNSSAQSQTCKFEVVPINYSLKYFKAYGRQFKKTKEEAEEYINTLKYYMDNDREAGKYDTYRY